MNKRMKMIGNILMILALCLALALGALARNRWQPGAVRLPVPVTVTGEDGREYSGKVYLSFQNEEDTLPAPAAGADILSRALYGTLAKTGVKDVTLDWAAKPETPFRGNYRVAWSVKSDTKGPRIEINRLSRGKPEKRAVLLADNQTPLWGGPAIAPSRPLRGACEKMRYGRLFMAQ